MHFDWAMAGGSFLVAVVVGLTGMGGGALMTPMLVTFFGISPLAAVSSDLVAAAVMKPVGSLVHLRRGTVDLRLVGWLCAGSVPAAFAGVLVARALGDGASVQDVVQKAMGVALLVAAAGIVVRAWLGRGRADAADDAASGDGGAAGDGAGGAPPAITVRPLPTALVGLVGGLVVGMTSVGSGSLIIVALLTLYPALRANQLVGTDLLQAVPLVFSAALGHLLFGDFHLDVTVALLAGSVPGVYLGSRISSRAPGGIIRRALAFVLVVSGLKMFGVPAVPLAWTIVGMAVVATAFWAFARARRPRQDGSGGEREAGEQQPGDQPAAGHVGDPVAP
ncbi:sulfite exporter TauE/SafE family protein [Actinomadura logoneensis]|uniref:Probable membrane transporter protein n=1 Tax=Actinomadura logoneensis TaxID=2293572 RepID=A0A372JCY7_9ACTN|nr:sulfite exporter TauE/SafE family protein [Actinomadura logoneensis]RFU37779.1 sulfite exporter TauE/SafE family protein [Actinomadura logoneensis]